MAAYLFLCRSCLCLCFLELEQGALELPSQHVNLHANSEKGALPEVQTSLSLSIVSMLLLWIVAIPASCSEI